MHLRAGDRVGSYEIVRRAAAGGCGVVYEGRSEAGDRVAIKILIGDSERAIARFEREAMLLSTFSHRNIVKYLDHGRTQDDTYFLIEEWVAGRVLSEELADRGFTMRETVEMARQVASALATAHDKGIVHRDIKPGNILREGENSDRFLVLDFGIARIIENEQRLTRTGALIGTIGYMSPEQARGEAGIEPSADVFGLGCVLFEALTGQPAFAGLNRLSIRAKILMDDPLLVSAYRPDAPVELVTLVRDMLAKDPGRRPTNGAAVGDRLDAISEIPDSEARPLQTVENPTVEMPITISPRSELTSLVLTGALSHLAGDDLEAWRERLRDAVSSFPGRPWVLDDGALVFASPAVEDGPEVAARAALAARNAIPELSISVVSTKRTDAIGNTIERAATALERESLQSIFADYTADQTEEHEGGIAIDETTAACLPDDFEVSRSGGKLFLTGIASRSAERNGGGD